MIKEKRILMGYTQEKMSKLLGSGTVLKFKVSSEVRPGTS